VRIRLEQDAGQAVVTVADNGAGMSPEFIRGQLFRPFNSTKSTGMGIGAYESYQYLKELGGSIDVESQLGKGSVITMSMPVFALRKSTDLGVGIED
jgi:signal transduction histidine kinase